MLQSSRIQEMNVIRLKCSKEALQKGVQMENTNYALVSADERGTVLALRGCVNAENSQSVEGGLLTLRAAHPAGTLSIDASVLDGITGAGMNVLMRIRKNEESLRLFNVSNDVYETLSNNGLTSVIKVEKAQNHITH